MKIKYIFFVVILLISFIFFVYYKMPRNVVVKQYDFINHILKKGGNVSSFTDENETKELVYNQFTREDIDNIKHIAFVDDEITDKYIDNMPPLKRLKDLYFSNIQLDIDIFDQLIITDIEQIIFRCGSLSDNLVFSRNRLKNIDVLSFYQMKMSDSIFKQWNGLPISRLFIIETPGISEVGLKYLLPQNELEYVQLWHTSITDNITDFFDGCPKLKAINILGGNIRCEFIRNMKWTDKVEELEIVDTNLDDEILTSISQFKMLNSLTIINCKITKKSKPLLEELGKKMYLISVYSDNEGDIFRQIKY